MEATILDLRYKMHDVLSALNRHEKVSIKYHGKLKAKLCRWQFPANENHGSTPCSACLKTKPGHRLN